MRAGILINSRIAGLMAVAGGLVPVLLGWVFGYDGDKSALGLAVAVFVSIPLFLLVGRWLDNVPYRRQLLVDIGQQLLSLLGLWLIAGMTGLPALVPLLLYGIIMVMLTLNDVSGAVLSAKTSPIGPSRGQGGYAFSMAIGGVLGAFLGGWAADAFGFASLPLVAAIGLGVAFVLGLFIPRLRSASSA